MRFLTCLLVLVFAGCSTTQPVQPHAPNDPVQACDPSTDVDSAFRRRRVSRIDGRREFDAAQMRGLTAATSEASADLDSMDDAIQFATESQQAYDAARGRSTEPPRPRTR